MRKKNDQHIDLHAVVDLLEARGSKPQSEPLVSPKNINVLVMGILATVGAFVWNSTTKTPETFALIQQQTAEIRTTVLEMKTTLGDIQTRLDNNTRATADQQAKLTGLEASVKSNSDRLDRLESQVMSNDPHRTR